MYINSDLSECCPWVWRLSSMATSFPGYSRRPFHAEREMSWKVPRERGYPRRILMYPVYSIFKTGSAADVTVKPRVLGRNLRVWLLFSPPKKKLYLKITLVISLATRSGTRAPYRFYWWLIWKLNPLVVAIIEFYPFQRLFIRTKFLEVVDGLILAETSLLIMLSGMQI